MSNVLLTGGAGFIGHHLAEHILKTTDHDIIILDRLDISGTLKRVDDVINSHPDAKSRVRFIWHDLKAEINEFVARDIGSVEYIYHLAAGSHVDRSITDPMSFVYDNVVGTGNLLEFARKYAKDTLKFFLYFSTDEVFGSAPEDVNFKEWDRYNSGNPYSASKAGAEELCVAYANTFRLPIHVTHTMNVVGIRQHPEKYIPLVIGKILDEETVYIHSNPDKTKAGTRFYIDVQDVSDAVMFITEHCLENPFPLQKFNIVGKDEIDNLSIALRISELMDKNIQYSMVDFHTARPGHDLRYALCGEKMKSMGWEPESVHDRLVDIVAWYLKPENSKWLFTNK